MSIDGADGSLEPNGAVAGSHGYSGGRAWVASRTSDRIPLRLASGTSIQTAPWLVVGSPAVVEAAMITRPGRTGGRCEISVRRVCVVVVTSLLSLYPVGEAVVICQRGSAADGHYRGCDCKHNLLHITNPEINFASWTTVLRHGPVFRSMLLR